MTATAPDAAAADAAADDASAAYPAADDASTTDAAALLNITTHTPYSRKHVLQSRLSPYKLISNPQARLPQLWHCIV